MKKTKTLNKWLATALMISMLPLQTFALSADQIHVKTEQPKQSLSLEITRDGKKIRGDRVVVKYKNDSKHFRTINLTAGETVESALAKYKGDKNVVSVEPDYIAYATAVPNDPMFSYQWNMDNTTGSGINVKKAWDISTGSGVVVAVVDTGVAYETYSSTGKSYTKAPDLANTCFVPGYDFINNDAHPNDDNDHGTHVAGTIAQSTNNGVGVAGIAYNACIMPVKVLDANGSGSYSAVANGIYYAADHGAKIINMSLGGPSDSSTLRDAVAYAYAHGVTVIVAAGNENTSAPSYPAAYNDSVISVGATDYAKNRAWYSNYGPDVDVVAPGGDTSADLNGDGYGDGILQNTFDTNPNVFSYYFFQGTSMATPHVAGTAALIIANGNATTPDDVREALQSTAQDIGAVGKDNQFGYGLIDAFAAVQWSKTAPTANAGADQTAVVRTSISFDGTSSTGTNPIVSYDWNFGDGILGTGITTNHTYTNVGTYTATLTVTDDHGFTGKDTATVIVNGAGVAPISQAGDDQTTTVGTKIAFNGSASTDDGSIVSYNWNFGDGVTPTTFVVQPGPVDGKDTDYGTVYNTTGCPDCETLYSGGWGDAYYDFFQFGLTGTPDAPNTSKAEIWLWANRPAGGVDPAFQMNRITSDWTEASTTKTMNPTSVLYKAMPALAIDGTSAWVKTDVTDLYKAWKNGTYVNYGIKVVPTNTNNSAGSIAASENSNAAIRPQLVVTTGSESLGTGMITEHTYTTAGTYTVTLTVTDDEGLTSTDTMIVTVDPATPVNLAPVANAGIDQTVLVNDSVSFNGTGSTDDAGIVSYDWNFGDGSFGTRATTSHVYTTTGNYTATLTVTDVEGLTGTDTAVITVNDPAPENTAPIANAGVDQTALVKASVSFNGSASTDDKGTVSYDWNFGDGSTATGMTTSHTFNTVGTFTVTLTATDAEGLTGTDTMIVTVRAANVVVSTMSAANTQVNKNYNISVSAKNNETTSQTVVYHIDVVNPKGVVMTWAGLADKTVTVSAGATVSQQWQNKVPAGSVKGTYTVNAKLMVNGVVTGTSSKTFTVK